MSEAELADAKLVFMRHYLLQLAQADAKLLPEERALLRTVCPPDVLRDRGLLAEDGTLTAKWVEELERAQQVLPEGLSLETKLAMITTFVDMAVIDGDLHHDEGKTLQEAADALGIDAEQFDAHLDGLTDQVGQLEGDDLEETDTD
ncbi:MAG: TerB family tellurite resistance protein [Myxococcota bacterium]